MGPNSLSAGFGGRPHHKISHVALKSSGFVHNLAGPNHICTVSLVLQSWTWSALLCKIHTKPPGPVGRWPGGKIDHKLKDLSTARFWKGKKQEEPSQNSLILVPCWTPPWQKSAKKRIREKSLEMVQFGFLCRLQTVACFSLEDSRMICTVSCQDNSSAASDSKRLFLLGGWFSLSPF